MKIPFLKEKFRCQTCDRIIEIPENLEDNTKIRCNNCLTEHIFYTIRQGETLPITINDYKVLVVKGV